LPFSARIFCFKKEMENSFSDFFFKTKNAAVKNRWNLASTLYSGTRNNPAQKRSSFS